MQRVFGRWYQNIRLKDTTVMSEIVTFHLRISHSYHNLPLFTQGYHNPVFFERWPENQILIKMSLVPLINIFKKHHFNLNMENFKIFGYIIFETKYSYFRNTILFRSDWMFQTKSLLFEKLQFRKNDPFWSFLGFFEWTGNIKEVCAVQL